VAFRQDEERSVIYAPSSDEPHAADRTERDGSLSALNAWHARLSTGPTHENSTLDSFDAKPASPMPFYDNDNKLIDDVEGSNMHLISHLHHWFAPADQGKTRLLKTLTQNFFAWTKADTGEDILLWREAVHLALTVGGTRTDAKDYQFNACIFSGEEVERMLDQLLGLLEIKSHETLGAFLDDALVTIEKLSPEEKNSLALSGEGLGARTSPGDWADDTQAGPSRDWEDLLTFEWLAKYGRRLAGFLAGAEFEDTQALFCGNPLLNAVLAHEMTKGNVTEETVDEANEDLDDGASEEDKADHHKAVVRVARTVTSAIAKAANMPAFMHISYRSRDDAIEGIIALIEGSEKIHEGDSEFMLSYARENAITNAPTANALLKGTVEHGAFVDLLLEIAASCPKDTAPTTPKELFTVAGMRKLERQLSTYEPWITSAATQAMHARVRVTSLAERMQRNEQNNSAGRCHLAPPTRRANAHQQTPPPPPSGPRCTHAPAPPRHTAQGGGGDSRGAQAQGGERPHGRASHAPSPRSARPQHTCPDAPHAPGHRR